VLCFAAVAILPQVVVALQGRCLPTTCILPGLSHCISNAFDMPVCFAAAAAGGGGAAGALSADDLRAALRAAEDEADVAAAATAEKEVEAEMAEFTAEPPPEELKDEDLDGEDGDTRTGMFLEQQGGGAGLAVSDTPRCVSGAFGGGGGCCVSLGHARWGRGEGDGGGLLSRQCPTPI
jgi:hypothetical protein